MLDSVPYIHIVPFKKTCIHMIILNNPVVWEESKELGDGWKLCLETLLTYGSVYSKYCPNSQCLQLWRLEACILYIINISNSHIGQICACLNPENRTMNTQDFFLQTRKTAEVCRKIIYLHVNCCPPNDITCS